MFNPSHRHRGVRSVRTFFAAHRRLILTMVAVFSVLFALAQGFVRNSGAQGIDDSAFARKADKVLRSVRDAAEQDRQLLAAGKLKRDDSQLERMRRTVGIERRQDGRVIVDVAVKLTETNTQELKSHGFSLAARLGDIATLSVDVDRLSELASLSSVIKLSAAVQRYPLNDRARLNTGVDDTSGQRVVPQTGRKVVIGIIDTGIDFRHLDFTVPGSGGRQTRIKALLDMTVYSQAPDPGWNYVLPGQSAAIGHLYTEADLNAALQIAKPADQNSDIVKQRDQYGHGTHVAGTAAGNGLASPTVGTYAGMAPEADLIIVKATRQNTADASFRTTDTINALNFIQQKAAELGEPFVINMSLGGQLGPHDGTDPDERAIDNLVNGASGRAVVVAAGNEGDSGIHAHATVPTSGSLTLDLNASGSPQFIDLYYSNADRFSVTLRRPDGVTVGPVAYDPNGFSSLAGQASDQYVDIYNTNDSKGDNDPANDQPDIFLAFKSGAPNGVWKITLNDADSNANQPFDAWAGGDGVRFGAYSDDGSHLVGSPGTARGAITVGAFVTRSATQTIGNIALFSSPGPTADGRQKPEISAPGYYLYSSRSSDVVGEFGTIGTGSNAPTDSTHYTGLAGTSMATPVTTGAVALLLESNPTLSSAEITSRLTNNAVKDIFTGADSWNVRFGFGKLNIVNAISQSGGGVRRYSISGRVTDSGGQGIPDLQMSLALQGSGAAIVRTDSNGYYTFANLLGGGNYMVAPPSPSSLTYSPSTYTFNNLGANQTANFLRPTVTTVTISGRITDSSGNGVPGLSVELPGSTDVMGSWYQARTDANGNYSLTVPPGKNYTVTPTSPNYKFTPGSRSYLGLTENQTGVNFTAEAVDWQLQAHFADAFRTAFEGGSNVAVFVTRGGDGLTTASVDYSTDDFMAARCDGVSELASAKCDYVSTGGTLRFAPGETMKRIEVPIINDTFVEANEKFNVTLTNPHGLTLVWPSTITITIQDDDRDPTAANAFLNNAFFVRQQYLDFLLREPDTAGFADWNNLLNGCGAGQGGLGSPPECDRVQVSSGFFRSTEFGEKGYWIYRFYESAMGRRPQFTEFMGEMRRLSGQMTDSEQEVRRADFIARFMQLPEFTSNFAGLTDSSHAAQFIAKLEQTARLTLPESATTQPGQAPQYGRQQLINLMASGQFSAAQTLRAFVEQKVVWDTYFYRAFVAMQYFGYLRRDPEAAGYDDWVDVLTNGRPAQGIPASDYRHLIFGFVYSVEYRERFGKP